MPDLDNVFDTPLIFNEIFVVAFMRQKGADYCILKIINLKFRRNYGRKIPNKHFFQMEEASVGFHASTLKLM